MISKLEGQTAIVLEPVDAELAQAIRLDTQVYADETPWRQAGAKVYLWLAQSERATYDRINLKRDADTARAMLGSDETKVVICDRYCAYSWVKTKPWCWAHVRRDFQAMIDRDDGGSRVARRLLLWSDHLFWAWHRVADGVMAWDEFLWWASRLGTRLRADLEAGRRCESKKTRGRAATRWRGRSICGGFWLVMQRSRRTTRRSEPCGTPCCGAGVVGRSASWVVSSCVGC